MPAAVALTANAHSPATRSRAIAAFDTAQLGGVVMGGWFGGFMAQEYQWRWAFYSLGLCGILYSIPYYSFLKHTDEQAQVETKRSGAKFAISALIRVPSFRILCIVFPAFTFVLWLLYAWLPSFLYDKFSLSLTEAGFTATVFLQAATLRRSSRGWARGRLAVSPNSRLPAFGW